MIAFIPQYGVPRFAFYSVGISGLVIISIVMSAAYALLIRSLKRSRVIAVQPMSTQRESISSSMNNATITAAATSSTDATISKINRRLAVDNVKQLHITSTVAILVAVVLVSWTPCFISGLVWALDISTNNKDSTKVTMHYLSLTIGFASLLANPFLYCWRIGKVRRAAIEVFRNIMTLKIFQRS